MICPGCNWLGRCRCEDGASFERDCDPDARDCDPAEGDKAAAAWFDNLQRTNDART